MTTLLVVAVVSLCVLAYVITLRNLTTEVDRALAREASAYSAAVRSAPASEALITATRTYLQGRETATSGMSPILLLSFENGRVISNSALRLETAPGNRPLVSPVNSPEYFDVKLGETTYRTLAVPVTGDKGLRLGTFQVALSADTPKSVATGVAAALGAAGILVLLLGAIVSVWAARGALRPLTRMAADAASISLASPGKRIAYNGPEDELGTLASSLNAMLVRLEIAYDDQRRFVADASHELRTPVAIVRGNIELLRSGRSTERDSEEALAMIENEAIRMSRLLDELLSLARLEGHSRPFQALEVRTLLEEAAARARTLGDRVITLDGPCGIWVEGDPDLLDQALVNIMRNAIAHTHDGGSITIGCTYTARTVRIAITDDGLGIPEADLGRIFDRFYRAQGKRADSGGGAGLGLAIAKRLVEIHSGIISAENAVPNGARFVIELPRIAEPS
jgi:signal transduction histidine kinase